MYIDWLLIFDFQKLSLSSPLYGLYTAADSKSLFVLKGSDQKKSAKGRSRFLCLTIYMYLLLSSADNLCKQFGPRSGAAKSQS